MDSKTSEQTGIRVGVDIGGTFTDIIAFDPGSGVVEIEKVPSTPSTPAEGVINGLEMLFSQTHINPSDITYFSHGSTVSINALIEREGAKTGLLVTEGYRKLLLALAFLGHIVQHNHTPN